MQFPVFLGSFIFPQIALLLSRFVALLLSSFLALLLSRFLALLLSRFLPLVHSSALACHLAASLSCFSCSIPEVFSLEFVAGVVGVHGEIFEIAFSQFFHFLVDFVGLLLASLEDLVDVVVGDVALLRGEHVVRSVADHGKDLAVLGGG